MTDADLNAVIGACRTATGRVSPSFAPKAHSHNDFWIEDEMYFRASRLVDAMEEIEVATLAAYLAANWALHPALRLVCNNDWQWPRGWRKL